MFDVSLYDPGDHSLEIRTHCTPCGLERKVGRDEEDRSPLGKIQ